jgi:three-Cys-motif partner protein
VSRPWGFWTRYKLEILERYLDRFTTTTKNKVDKIVYLDLFGGEPENYDRLSGNPIDGSARIALSTADPAFTHLRFFELEGNAAKLRAALDAEFPDRDFIVYPGDCNETIHCALADLRRAGVQWAPTFAFIDPNGPHYTWETLAALAEHKGLSAKTKVELWMLFPDPLFARLLPTSGQLRQADDQAITKMFGSADWHAIWEAKLRDVISASEARAEYVDLMRWRLERQLGYRWTHQLEIRNEKNLPIYHLIFATDSEPGHKIMSHLYDRAAEEFPAMAAQARADRSRIEMEASGQFDLFHELSVDLPSRPSGRAKSPQEKLYIHEPPDAPRPHDRSACPYCT